MSIRLSSGNTGTSLRDPLAKLIDQIIGILPQKVWWLNSAICALIILYVGSRPGTDIPDLSILPGLDKVLHFCAYSGFAACLFRACFPLRASEEPRVKMPWLPVILGPFLVGLMDEIHQGSVAGRGQDGFDLMADTLGGITVCLFGLWWRNKVRSADVHKRMALGRGL